jgi:malate/lactate dehydrogenase
MNDPIPSAVQEVLDLFASELAALRFGDLEPGILNGAADEVRSVAAEVARVSTEFDAVRARLAEKQEALLQKTQRALAYARVYAEDQPALAARIEAISVPRTVRRAGKVEAMKLEIEEVTSGESVSRRRGRPRKAETSGALLELTPMDAIDAVPLG